MSLPIIFLMAAVSVATFLFFVLRLVRWATLLRFHWLADVVLTAALFVLFYGTLGGTLVAALGGLLFSVILSAGKAAQRASGALRRLV